MNLDRVFYQFMGFVGGILAIITVLVYYFHN